MRAKSLELGLLTQPPALLSWQRRRAYAWLSPTKVPLVLPSNPETRSTALQDLAPRGLEELAYNPAWAAYLRGDIEEGQRLDQALRERAPVIASAKAAHEHFSKGELLQAALYGGLATLEATSFVAPFIPNSSAAATGLRVGAQQAEKQLLQQGVKGAAKGGSQFMKYQGDFVLKPGWKNWGKYVSQRGWKFDDIQQTLLKGKWQPWTKNKNWMNPGNSMSIITNPQTGKSLIIDNVTKEVIQLGKSGHKF